VSVQVLDVEAGIESEFYLEAINNRASELSKMTETLLFLLLLFPFWWLIAGYFFNCSSKKIGITLTLIFVGGIVGFFIAFACNGGAGGSSQMSSSAWGCLAPYLVIYHLVLAYIIFSGQRKKES